MSETTTQPVYVAVKTRKAYKVDAKATVLSIHDGTNMLAETNEKVILDDVLYEGFVSAKLAEFEAQKDVERMLSDDPDLKGVKMEDVTVTSRLF